MSRRPVSSIGIAFALTAATLAASTLLGPPTASAGTRPSGKLTPPAGALLGAFVNYNGAHGTLNRENEVLNVESSIGRKLGIDHHYNSWTERLDQQLYKWDLAGGRIPMISWAGYNTKAIESGSQDSLIRTQANYLKSLGKPVFLRWGWEMTGSWSSSWANSAADYVAAWRRIHNIFAAQGAVNAVWVWCPDHGAFDDGTAGKWYPGDSYVDWVCTDGYNRGDTLSWSNWNSVYQLFDKFYAWAVQHNKPVMIGETASVEGAAGQKGKWFTGALSTLKTNFPAVEAFVYWDAIGHCQGVEQNFLLTSSTSSLSGFKQMALDPYMN